MAWLKRVLRRWPVMVGGLLLIAVGFGASIAWNSYQASRTQHRYDLLSRRILVDAPNDTIMQFKDLQAEYDNYINRQGLGDSVGLYFEYLPTGSSIGINEDREVEGASLLKLPLSMRFYKYVEEGKLSLDTKVSLKKEWLSASYGDLYKKGEGYQLTYRQALEYALQRSDNTAALVLFDAVARVERSQTPGILDFVDIDYATTKEKDILIGPQSYGSMLKCLYFSCYLSKSSSQAVLGQLTESTNNQRLTRYTPNDLTAAHKIGVFGQETQSDCGIFYVPKRNYLLCVMVRGEKESASAVIGDLSLMTYEYLAPPTNE